MKAMLNKPLWKTIGLALVLLCITGFLAVAIRYVLAGNTIGADFFIYWRAGRAAFLERQLPYDEEVTRSIQMGILGRPAQPGEDQLAYAYPAYALFFVYPFIWLDFPSAQAAWMAIHLVSWLATGIYLSRRRPWLGGTIIFFYPLAFGILLGNYNILVGLAVLLLFGLVYSHHPARQGKQILGGILLAASLIKPQFVWLPAALGVLLAFRWRSWALLASAGVAAVLLVTSSLVIFPGWVPGWIEQSRAYSGYIPPQALVAALPGSLSSPVWQKLLMGTSLAVLALVTVWMIALWINKPISGVLSMNEILLFAWLSLVTYLVHPWPKSYEQIIVLAALFLWSVALVEKRPLMTAAIWVMGIGISWWALADEQAGLTALGIYGWPVLYFFIWIGFAWIQTKER